MTSKAPSVSSSRSFSNIQAELLKRFLPLSLSDVSMMLGDPLQTMALSRLPAPELNLASIGVAKAFSVFVESPIIMILHASTALSGNPVSREALRRFVLICAVVLTSLCLAFTAIDPLYGWLLRGVFGVSAEVAAQARPAFALMLAWPAAIAWRRYQQGTLIRAGRNRDVARATLFRVAWVIAVLAWGLVGRSWSGAALAAAALAGGALVECGIVSWIARGVPSSLVAMDSSTRMALLPRDVPSVAKYYAPLAFTMVLLWGSRAALLATVARAHDGALTLAAWPAAWGLVFLVASSTRMVQQVVISSKGIAARDLLLFSAHVGFWCSLGLTLLAFTPLGAGAISVFVGADGLLAPACQESLRILVPLPLLVSVQNGLQGLLIRQGRNKAVNLAALGLVALTLGCSALLVRAGAGGVASASWASLAGFAAEVLMLAGFVKVSRGQTSTAEVR